MRWERGAAGPAGAGPSGAPPRRLQPGAKRPWRVLLLFLWAGFGAGCGGRVGQTESGLSAADSLVASAVESGLVPGAVLLVARDGRTILEAAYGHAQSMALPEGIPSGSPADDPYGAPPRPMDDPVPMTAGTAFDLASVTKVMATTMALMLLVDRGQVDLEAPLYHYLSEFRGPQMDSVTVKDLLTHSAGLAQWQPIYYAAEGPEEAFRVIREMGLSWGVGEARHYSDLGFMILGYLVEGITERPLDVFLHQELYGPLGLERTGFRRLDCLRPAGAGGRTPGGSGLSGSGGRGRGEAGPVLEGIRVGCPPGPFAATSHGNPYEWRMVHDSTFGYLYRGDPTSWNGWRRHTLVGEVNDGNAFHAHRGVAGHAGLFSTAAELGRLLQFLLDGGVSRGRPFLREETVARFLRPGSFGQALGWQTPAWAPAGSFSHPGFTGTYVMGIPSRGLAIVLLTNRQNLGVGEDTRYPDLGELQQSVVRAILGGAGEGSRSSGASRGAAQGSGPSPGVG